MEPLRLPDLVALRRLPRAGVPASCACCARRTGDGGDRARRVEARRRRPVAARDPARRPDVGRDGRGRGPPEPVEHPPRPARAALARTGPFVRTTLCLAVKGFHVMPLPKGVTSYVE